MLRNHKTTLLYIVFFILLFTLYAFPFSHIPYGFFCDEAEIGRNTYLLIHGDFSNFVNPFFYQHFNYILGSLPVFATAPFIAIFGLTEFAVRFTSYFYAILSIVTLFFILRKMKCKYVFLPVLIFSFTPIFFHISRINFGHYPSLFFVLMGIYFYIKTFYKGRHSGERQRDQNRFWTSQNDLLSLALSGLCFGLSLYGYSSFLLTTPAFVFSIFLSQISRPKKTLFLMAIFFLCTLPIIFTAINNPAFFNRLRDKNQGQNIIITEKLQKVAANYSKYYNYSFLFSEGEIKRYENPITRHSVHGNGVLLRLAFPLIIGSILCFIFKGTKRKLLYLPFFLSILTYPLPDLLSTKTNDLPYTFSLFPAVVIVPFVISYFLETLPYIINKKREKILIIVLYAAVILEALSFLNNYARYPLYASDYWGWQSGAKEIVAYFRAHSKEYDDLYMSVYFNQPGALISFYDPQGVCKNCRIGGLTEINPTKRQLFALQTFEIPLDKPFIIEKIIYYPDGKEAFYIGRFIQP